MRLTPVGAVVGLILLILLLTTGLIYLVHFPRSIRRVLNEIAKRNPEEVPPELFKRTIIPIWLYSDVFEFLEKPASNLDISLIKEREVRKWRRIEGAYSAVFVLSIFGHYEVIIVLVFLAFAVKATLRYFGLT